MKYLLIVTVLNTSSGEALTSRVSVLDDQAQCPQAAQAVLSSLEDPFGGTQRISCRPLPSGTPA